MRILGIPLAVIMPVGLGSAPPAQAVTVPPALEIAEDFPDVVDVGGTWYAYATNGPRGQVPVASAASLDGSWTVRGDAMPRPGGWSDDYPVVRGSRVRYEAERGRLNHCVVRTGAAGASQGAVVAYIDYPDSWFEVDAFAPVAGAYTVHIGYANGSPATATHTLTVNGGAPVTATYPVTGWDNWRQTSVGVQLTAGFNRIRLAKGAWYAEVDYLEVA